MCGIAGLLYADTARTPQQPLLHAMGDAIAHRGPDGEGLFRANNVGLVHRRLAIIDLAGGNQPIANEDESVQVVFNGEIYNYPELRKTLEGRGHQFRTHSDTEVLVHLYEDHGEDLVSHLRGMFAFALWDARQRSLLLARDHVGQKPLYVYRDEEKLLFGSELKAILAHPNVDRTICPEAIEDYLTFGFIPGQRSIFRNIHRLPAGHTLTVRAPELNWAPRRFWQLSFDNEVAGTDQEWQERIADKISESVRIHMLADVPVGAFLSGGLDSSSIVAVASQMVSEPLQTFAIGFQEKQFSELPHAEAVSRHFNTRHTEQIVTPQAVQDLDDLIHFYDEPFADASAIPTMAVARMAAQHVKVALSGDGGDEAFGGYSRYSHDLKEAAVRNLLPFWLRSQLLKPLGQIWPKADWLPRPLRLKTLLQNLAADPAAAYANTLSACRGNLRSRLLNTSFAGQLASHRPEHAIEQAFLKGQRDQLSGMLSADTAVLLPDDFLTKVDRASMAYGLEVRPPLLDFELLELAASMPSRLKIRNGSKKWILKQLFQAKLPDQLAHRRKQGFELPVDEWLRNPLQDQIHQIVLNPQSQLATYINTSTARQMYQSHCQHTGNHGQVLWSLLVLGRWLDQYGSDNSPSHDTTARHTPEVLCTASG
jgi:asparagine synthase (glutamine-hydrolysing)